MYLDQNLDPQCNPAQTLGEIEQLFAEHGHTAYNGARAESVSALAHALQCAQLAEWAHASPPQVAAALLHDVGHFIAPRHVQADDRVDDDHEHRATPLLAAFGPAVLAPVQLHVLAKRALVRLDAGYLATLSPASVHSLALQGGPLDDAALQAFLTLPFAPEALQLRRWDDAAKLPGKRTPPLDYYLALLEGLLMQPLEAGKTAIGDLSTT